MSRHHRLSSRLSLHNRSAFNAWSTFPWSPSSQRPSPDPDLDVVLVHGCRNSRDRSANRLEKSLLRTAKTISEQLEGCRVHVYGYDASRVLHKGKKELDSKALQLLTFVKEKCGAKVAMIAHNSSAWVVQHAIVEMPYSESDFEVSVGIIFFGLPYKPSHGQWLQTGWDVFSHALAKHLDRRESDMIGDVQLDFPTIETTMSKFEMRQKQLGQYLHTKMISCSNARGVQQVPRTSTHGSDESSSSTGSCEDAGTVLVSINEKELQDIIGSLNQMSERSPDPRSAIVSTRPTSPSSARRVVFNRTSSVVVCRAPVEQQRSDDIRRYSLHQGAVPTVGNRPVHSTLTPPPVRSDTAMDPVAIGQPIQQPPHEVMKESGKYEEDSHGLGDTKASRKGSPSKITSEFMLHAPENTSANFEEISNPKLHLSQLDETNLESSQDLAGCYFRGGDLDEAEKLYNDLIKECIRAINYFRYAGKVFRMKLHVAQITWLKGCHRDSEKDFKILNDTVETFRDEVLTCKTAKWLALSQWKQGKYAEAKKTIQDCVDKEPGERNENKALLSTRALILASAGSFRWALRDSIKAIDGRTHGIEQKELPKMQKIICNINHARVLSEIGRYDEATVKNNEALSDLQKSLGPKHLVTLDAASLRAWLLVVNTNTSETGEEVQRTLRQMRERLGENHPSTLQTVQTLVLAYKNDGRYSDAEATARYLVRKCEDSRELGRAHPQTLKSKTILAQVLLAVGTLKEAEECQREVVKDEKTTYFQQVTLANILRESGKWDEARDLAIRMMLEQLHKFSRDEEEDSHTEHDQPKEITGEELAGVQITSIDLEKILLKSQHVRSKLQKLPQGLSDPTAGPHPVRVYPSLIQTMQCVALCEQVRDDANLAFAEALLKKIHEICVQKLGTSHQFTTTVEHDLAVNHRLSGKFLQARRVIDRVIEQRRSTLGTDHPDYLLSRHQRSVVLLRLSRWQEALKEQEFVLRAQHFLLGTRHPMTVLSRYTLAGIYHSLNRFEEADDLLLKVIIDQREVYNPTRTDLADHAIVIRTRARFALVRLDRALFTSAKSEQKSVVEHRTKHLGKNHHLTQSSLNDLAQIEQASGNKTEAEKIYKSLLIIMDGQDPNPMEKSHENILAFQVQSNLATCYYEKGLYEKAKGLQGDLYKELAGRQETDDRFVASAFNLALTCKALRESQYACNLLRETVQASQRRLGDEHPQTQELKATLTEWNKQYANSESLDRTEDWRRSNA